MRITANKQSGLSHCIGTTKRFLRKARDLYVDSMIHFAGKFSSATVVSCPATHLTHLPKNFNGLNSTRPDHDQNLEKLYQSLFKKYNWTNMEFDRVGLKERAGGCVAMDRSYSVAVGRIGTIDEEEQCEFQEDIAVKSDILFPRSRSHTVTMKNY